MKLHRDLKNNGMLASVLEWFHVDVWWLDLLFISQFPSIMIWNHPKETTSCFSGSAWASRNILMLLQPSSVGVSSRSSPQPAAKQWSVLEVEVVLCHFPNQDFSFRKLKEMLEWMEIHAHLHTSADWFIPVICRFWHVLTMFSSGWSSHRTAPLHP